MKSTYTPPSLGNEEQDCAEIKSCGIQRAQQNFISDNVEQTGHLESLKSMDLNRSRLNAGTSGTFTGNKFLSEAKQSVNIVNSVNNIESDSSSQNYEKVNVEDLLSEESSDHTIKTTSSKMIDYSSSPINRTRPKINTIENNTSPVKQQKLYSNAKQSTPNPMISMPLHKIDEQNDENTIIINTTIENTNPVYARKKVPYKKTVFTQPKVKSVEKVETPAKKLQMIKATKERDDSILDKDPINVHVLPMRRPQKVEVESLTDEKSESTFLLKKLSTGMFNPHPDDKDNDEADKFFEKIEALRSQLEIRPGYKVHFLEQTLLSKRVEPTQHNAFKTGSVNTFFKVLSTSGNFSSFAREITNVIENYVLTHSKCYVKYTPQDLPEGLNYHIFNDQAIIVSSNDNIEYLTKRVLQPVTLSSYITVSIPKIEVISDLIALILTPVKDKKEFGVNFIANGFSQEIRDDTLYTYLPTSYEYMVTRYFFYFLAVTRPVATVSTVAYSKNFFNNCPFFLNPDNINNLVLAVFMKLNVSMPFFRSNTLLSDGFDSLALLCKKLADLDLPPIQASTSIMMLALFNRLLYNINSTTASTSIKVTNDAGIIFSDLSNPQMFASQMVMTGIESEIRRYQNNTHNTKERMQEAYESQDTEKALLIYNRFSNTKESFDRIQNTRMFNQKRTDVKKDIVLDDPSTHITSHYNRINNQSISLVNDDRTLLNLDCYEIARTITNLARNKKTPTFIPLPSVDNFGAIVANINGKYTRAEKSHFDRFSDMIKTYQGSLPPSNIDADAELLIHYLPAVTIDNFALEQLNSYATVLRTFIPIYNHFYINDIAFQDTIPKYSREGLSGGHLFNLKIQQELLGEPSIVKVDDLYQPLNSSATDRATNLLDSTSHLEVAEVHIAITSNIGKSALTPHHICASYEIPEVINLRSLNTNIPERRYFSYPFFATGSAVSTFNTAAQRFWVFEPVIDTKSKYMKSQYALTAENISNPEGFGITRSLSGNVWYNPELFSNLALLVNTMDSAPQSDFLQLFNAMKIIFNSLKPDVRPWLMNSHYGTSQVAVTTNFEIVELPFTTQTTYVPVSDRAYTLTRDVGYCSLSWYMANRTTMNSHWPEVIVPTTIAAMNDPTMILYPLLIGDPYYLHGLDASTILNVGTNIATAREERVIFNAGADKYCAANYRPAINSVISKTSNLWQTGQRRSGILLLVVDMNPNDEGVLGARRQFLADPNANTIIRHIETAYPQYTLFSPHVPLNWQNANVNLSIIFSAPFADILLRINRTLEMLHVKNYALIESISLMAGVMVPTHSRTYSNDDYNTLKADELHSYSQITSRWNGVNLNSTVQPTQEGSYLSDHDHCFYNVPSVTALNTWDYLSFSKNPTLFIRNLCGVPLKGNIAANRPMFQVPAEYALHRALLVANYFTPVTSFSLDETAKNHISTPIAIVDYLSKLKFEAATYNSYMKTNILGDDYMEFADIAKTSETLTTYRNDMLEVFHEDHTHHNRLRFLGSDICKFTTEFNVTANDRLNCSNHSAQFFADEYQHAVEANLSEVRLAMHPLMYSMAPFIAEKLLYPNFDYFNDAIKHNAIKVMEDYVGAETLMLSEDKKLSRQRFKTQYPLNNGMPVNPVAMANSSFKFKILQQYIGTIPLTFGLFFIPVSEVNPTHTVSWLQPTFYHPRGFTSNELLKYTTVSNSRCDIQISNIYMPIDMANRLWIHIPTNVVHLDDANCKFYLQNAQVALMSGVNDLLDPVGKYADQYYGLIAPRTFNPRTSMTKLRYLFDKEFAGVPQSNFNLDMNIQVKSSSKIAGTFRKKGQDKDNALEGNSA